MKRLLILLALFSTSVQAFEFPHVVQQDGVKLELFPRSSEQIASFYEARGFPKAMIEQVTQHCFITVRIHNQRAHKLWLNISSWTFHSDGTPLTRYHRNDLLRSLREAGYPAPSIATFRWTLLPETLDYLPDEQESGNVLITDTDAAITLVANFATGDDQQGEPVSIRYEGLKCAR